MRNSACKTASELPQASLVFPGELGPSATNGPKSIFSRGHHPAGTQFPPGSVRGYLRSPGRVEEEGDSR